MIDGGETKCDGRTNMFSVQVKASTNPLYDNDATVLSVSGSGTVETSSVNPRATPNVTLLNNGNLVKKPNVFPMPPIAPSPNIAYMQYTAIGMAVVNLDLLITLKPPHSKKTIGVDLSPQVDISCFSVPKRN